MVIDNKLITEILDKYNTFVETETLESIELDEEERQFVRGYLCRMVQQDNAQKSGDNLIRNQIIQTRSKYCEPILELLAAEGELYHGDLAEKLNMSPSGLNAIIKKMQETNPAIIKTTQIGKYKIYSLPEEVQNFILKKESPPIQNEVEENNRFPQKMKRNNMFLELQHFVDLAGNDWRDYFSLLLQRENDNIPVEIKNEFVDLINLVASLYEKDVENVEKFKKILNNEVLIYLFDDYMESNKKVIKIIAQIQDLTAEERQVLKNML